MGRGGGSLWVLWVGRGCGGSGVGVVVCGEVGYGAGVVGRGGGVLRGQGAPLIILSVNDID